MPTTTKTMFLFLKTETVPSESEFIDMVVHGSTAGRSGEFSGFDLFTYSDDSGNIQERTLPLFLDVFNWDTGIRNVNLWVSGERHRATKEATLFLQNDGSGVELPAPLYIRGSGETDGAWLQEWTMNLVLERSPANGFELYLRGPGTEASGSVDLFINALLEETESMDMSVPDVVGNSELTGKLYTHGW